MVIKFARIRFDDETTKYYIKPITAIKENVNDDDKKHITPAHENDFDSKHTYYCKFTLCEETCVENHMHYEYYPCRVFLLGESIQIIDKKVKEKRCAIPKLHSDLGQLQSTNNENILKLRAKEAKKNAKNQRSTVKRTRNKTILNTLARTFVDSEDSKSECSETSQHSLRPVSIRIQRINKSASQPSKSTLHESQQSQLSENEENNFSDDSHTHNQPNLLEPSCKKFKSTTCQFQSCQDASDLENEIPATQTIAGRNDKSFEDNVAAGNGADNSNNGSAGNGANNSNNSTAGNGANAGNIGTAENHEDAENNVQRNVIDEGLINGDQGNQNPPNEEVDEEEINSEEENNQNQAATKEMKMKDFIISSVKYYKGADGRGFEERQRRYTTYNGEIYLGENITAQSLEWDMANLERPPIFLVLVAQMLWPPHDLANRALEVTENMKNIPDRSPIKLIEKNLLRLLISLYHDYLKRDKCMNNETRANYLLKTTYTLRTKIKNLRAQERKAKTPRNVPNARKRLRYNVID